VCVLLIVIEGDAMRDWMDGYGVPSVGTSFGS